MLNNLLSFYTLLESDTCQLLSLKKFIIVKFLRILHLQAFVGV